MFITESKKCRKVVAEPIIIKKTFYVIFTRRFNKINKTWIFLIITVLKFVLQCYRWKRKVKNKRSSFLMENLSSF